MRRESGGYGLIELLAAVLLLSVAMAAVVVVFATQGRAYLRADTQATMQANLRLGMNMVTESLRNGKYGVPTANLSSWTTWVSGFTNNPTITTNGSNPAVISVASATSKPVATLTAHVDAAATTIYVSSSSQLNTGAQSLLLIGDSENALITGVNSTALTIDTNPLLAGNQGLARAYPAGTPVYRVDVPIPPAPRSIAWTCSRSRSRRGPPSCSAMTITGAVHRPPSRASRTSRC